MGLEQGYCGLGDDDSLGVVERLSLLLLPAIHLIQTLPGLS